MRPPSFPRVARALVVVTACAIVGPAAATLVGCKRTAAAEKEEPKASNLAVKDDSAGLLLTWIDERGDFHVEQSVKDVPLVGRDAVRVVDPTSDQPGDAVVVADLRTARADGTYPVRVMTRADFDALAIGRRQKRAPTLANAAAPAGSEGPLAPNAPPAPSGPPSAGAPADPGAVAARPAVIIYGASWCGACHQAAAYLKRKNIAYVEKDIEADEKADTEMRAKLRKAGLRAGSIPVIDVRGVVMVGFNPQQVEEALGRAM